MPFESLGAVSYSPSIVTMVVSVAVSEIFSVKEWCNSENQVRGRSRSLNSIDHIGPFASYFTLNNIVTLKSGLEVTQNH